jgi:glycine betaine transporter
MKTIVRTHAVFVLAMALALGVILLGLIFPAALDRHSIRVQNIILEHFGWAYLLSSLFFLVFCMGLAFSRFGTIKLGNDQEKPQYSYMAWFGMLFAAGMGIGLLFWSVAEPLHHYANPPPRVAPSSGASASFAMQHSFFHWGLHPWAIYIVMSLAVAYFSFRRRMAPLISSCFYPLLGNRIFGPIGIMIDAFAVIATLFGIVTSLGLGALQITSGLASISAIADTFTTTFTIIAVVTVLFLLSSMTGLDRGIQMLSKMNLLLAFALLLFMLSVGPTTYILNILTTTVGDYVSSLLTMSLSTNPFHGHEWTKNWTLFYWAWWISWAPFVGIFVASISRGRTIREFILGAMLVPTCLTFIWFSVFGGSALHLQLEEGVDIASKAVENSSTAMFELFAHYPLGEGLTLVAVVLLLVFFITSADSATYVLSMLTSNGMLRPPNSKKIIWGVTISSTASILLYRGGLEGLQRMAITAALPFNFIMLLLCYCLWLGLRYEWREQRYPMPHPDPEVPSERF